MFVYKTDSSVKYLDVQNNVIRYAYAQEIDGQTYIFEN